MSLNAENKADCAICKEEFALGSEYIEMPCKHIFDKECILQWLAIVCFFFFPPSFFFFFSPLLLYYFANLSYSTTVVQVPTCTHLLIWCTRLLVIYLFILFVHLLIHLFVHMFVHRCSCVCSLVCLFVCCC